MEVDADKVINNLCNQIKEMSKAMAIKDAQIELLQQEIFKLGVEK